MISYKNIHDIQQVRRRLKRNNYGGYYGQDHTADGDRLHEFTHGTRAVADSQANLGFCLDLAREYRQSLLVFKPYTIQVGGPSAPGLTGRLWPATWLKQHSEWLDSTHQIRHSTDTTDAGEMVGFYSYRACLCLDEHQGVYDVESGRRLTNRRETIQRMWALGFAANRGRPLAFAKTRWTGTKKDLELITQLADQYWSRRYESEVSKKLVSTYTSINRYAAWPGAW